jgi:hypothetical protein
MKIPPELLPVIQITLPIVLAIFGASWLQNKRLDDIVGRLGGIETVLREQGERLARLEERIPPPLIHR